MVVQRRTLCVCVERLYASATRCAITRCASRVNGPARSPVVVVGGARWWWWLDSLERTKRICCFEESRERGQLSCPAGGANACCCAASPSFARPPSRLGRPFVRARRYPARARLSVRVLAHGNAARVGAREQTSLAASSANAAGCYIHIRVQQHIAAVTFNSTRASASAAQAHSGPFARASSG